MCEWFVYPLIHWKAASCPVAAGIHSSALCDPEYCTSADNSQYKGFRIGLQTVQPFYFPMQLKDALSCE